MRVLGAVLGLLALFAFGFTWRDIRRGEIPDFGRLTGSATTLSATQLFETNYQTIVKRYSGKVDRSKLKYAAVGGLMASLGDPHTMFMEPKLAKEFNQETHANFVGIGARLDDDPLGAKVVVVFEKSPAERSGLKAGDTITMVDGKTVAGMPTEDIVTRIRGVEGTVVHLTIIRPKVAQAIELYPKRATIVAPTVEGTIIPGTNIGRLVVSSFSEPTTEQYESELKKLENLGARALILDMRSNGGGLLSTAVDMLSLYVENKLVVTMKGREGRVQAAFTESGRVHKYSYPIVALVNEDSASATEIFVGCMRDYGKLTVVGEHTYGKASVQDVQGLTDGSSAKYTIAKYYLPVTADISRRVDEDGQYVEGGLQPDVKVELDPAVDTIFGDIKTDGQLQKAVDVVKSKM